MIGIMQCTTLFVGVSIALISDLSFANDGLDTLEEINLQKLELRKRLVQATQDLITERNDDFDFFHSYTFKTGAGNREELQVKILKGEGLFEAGRNVSSWQLISRPSGEAYLMGASQNTLSLVVANKHLLTNRSVHFTENSLDFGSGVLCMSLFTRWNASTRREEVMAAVAFSNPPDILWLRITDRQMEEFYRLPHHRRTAAMSIITTGSYTRLVLVDSDAPITLHYYDIIFHIHGSSLEMRLIQSFPLDGACRSMSVIATPTHVYLALFLKATPSVAVFRSSGSHFDPLAHLDVPGIASLQSFRMANQVFLAMGGGEAAIVRITNSGDLVSELSPGEVSEWLIAPIDTYRKDIVLFARTAGGVVKMFVWGGTAKGFTEARMPECDACLDHQWRGALALPFHSQTLLLLPRPDEFPSLVTMSADLGVLENPVLLKVRATVAAMKNSEAVLAEVRSRVAEAEVSLRYIVKRNEENMITSDWKIEKLQTNVLDLSEGASINEIRKLTNQVSTVTKEVNTLVQETEIRREELWGIRNFTGKLTINGQLKVNNLTVDQLNGFAVDSILHETYRRDRPKTIEGKTVVQLMTADSVEVESFNDNVPSDRLMYKDQLLVIRENLTALGPVSVSGKVELMPGVTINGNPVKERKWAKVVAGRNLTVLRINGLDWSALNKSVVYKHRYQMVPGEMIIGGNLESDGPMWVGTVDDGYIPVKRKTNESVPILKKPQVQNNKKHQGLSMKPDRLMKIDPYSHYVFSELEVVGELICSESEWGEYAADVLRRDHNPVQVDSLKTFPAGVRTTNLNLTGFQLRTDSSSTTASENDDYLPEIQTNGGQIIAEAVLVTESLNGVPLADLVYTDGKTIVVQELDAKNADVTQNIVVDGKVCGYNLSDWSRRRLSIKDDQNISGYFDIGNVHTDELSGLEELDSLLTTDEIYLKNLHVDGDIATEKGVNGYNLTAIGSNAVWLFGNNEITGHLTFQEEVRFQVLECQGFFNDILCVDNSENLDFIYRDDVNISISDEKKFLKPLKVTENVKVSYVNEHNFEEILSKTTEQEIDGDVYVTGDVSTNETVLFGFLNSQNMSQIYHRCSLKNAIITCSSDVVFESDVEVEHLNSSGLINGVNFDQFTTTLVNLSNPQKISGTKNFTRQSTVEQAMMALVNGREWNEFFTSAANQRWPVGVRGSVNFSQPLTVGRLYVNGDMLTNSVNNVSLAEWQQNAIYLNESFVMKRPLHLVGAASEGNISLMNYGPLNMGLDLIHRKGDATATKLSVGSLMVTDHADLTTPAGRVFTQLYQNTFKVSGDQTLNSGLTTLGKMTVLGNAHTKGLANKVDLLDAVSLNSNQTLNGSYELECVAVMGNVYSNGFISEINFTQWEKEAVLKDADQNVKGHWTVKGDLKLKGPANGIGRLANVSLIQLKENITENIVNVLRQMKSNLSAECLSTNELLRESRAQISRLVSLDQVQTLQMDSAISFISQFKSGDEHYLTLSENQCYTHFYKWNGLNGFYTYLYKDKLGLETKQIIALQRNESTYLVSVSSDLPSDCHFSGVNLWLFTEHHLKHITTFDLKSHTVLHGYKNNLLSMNSTHVEKWNLHIGVKSFYFHPIKSYAVETSGKKLIREEANLGLAFLDKNGGVTIIESKFPSLENLKGLCSQAVEYSVDSKLQLVAIALAEHTEVPRYADVIKIYHRDGHLYDKLQAHRPSQLQWLPVPDQTWLMFLDNFTALHLYHFQGGADGFIFKFSAPVEASEAVTLALPLHGYINTQPYILIQSRQAVTVIRAVLQGDPYLGPDATCVFDDDSLSVPNL